MMKRNWKLLLCLLTALVMLTACSGKPSGEEFPDITQAIGPTATPAVPTAPPVQGDVIDAEGIFDQNPYLEEEFTEEDILAEEDYVDPEYGVLEEYVPAVEGTLYPYAGSTPIPLNPVDMPTPTPKPDLSFTYAKYIANTVGVTLEAPENWQVNESQSGLFILSEPAAQVKDGQQCIITLSAEPVGSNYNQKELETHVQHRLDSIGGAQFSSFKPSYTATRHMLGSTGVYANYSGTLNDGTPVGGRIQYVSENGMLYGLEIVFPEGFRGDFIDVFGEVRSSLSFIK